ncbi:1-acyl-sn-glycerol-3-phosphate acyltransferase [Roseimaritima sediminicola]|uniref:1-acyl-sn-glycerol-3-phosphate acyltransferase n=1 Tax=Roseimaritima sediminicola TaxID=2662066 RepID=UPI0012982B8C|nr:1-acyl-sn-glycerol-3-phosphate acyltransferase [Roseimaritima sediminicola]
MSVIVEKPYRFVPPHHGNGWPTWIQRLRLVDLYLRRKEGIIDYECRHWDRVGESLRQGHGILLAPNHCRYADPLVMGWPARELNQHVYAMASWHLFNKNRFESFAIQKMGAFSLFREGQDRQSLEAAMDILAKARRPLILFPEGTTNRTNDRLQTLLDGVSFIARTAARRRQKADGGKVVIHPVGIKYVFQGDIDQWADRALRKLETRLGWEDVDTSRLLPRVRRVAEALLSLQEIAHIGQVQSGSLHERREGLIEALLEPIERERGAAKPGAPVLNRVRTLRSRLLPLLMESADEPAKERLRRLLKKVDLAQKLDSYPEGYLSVPPVTDTRVLETIQRMQEDFLGRPDSSYPLKAILEAEEPIEVPAERAPRGQVDPIVTELEQQLLGLLERLQHEANVLDEPPPR